MFRPDEYKKIRRVFFAFTLVELLVVIAIIALLMGILMPALARVRKQARSAVCMTYEKQWGVVFNCYAADFDNIFFAGSTRYASTSVHWYKALWRYKEVREDFDFWCCPSAKKTSDRGVSMHKRAYKADEQEGWYGEEGMEDLYGSYGMNNWCANETYAPSDQRGDPSYHWRTFMVKNASTIPLFLDAVWSSSWAYDTDEPINVEEYRDRTGVRVPESISRYLVARHGRGEVNVLFLDFSVRRVKLPDLWRQKWHRQFDTNCLETKAWVWPDWLKKML